MAGEEKCIAKMEKPSWEHFEKLEAILSTHIEHVHLMEDSRKQSTRSQDLATFDGHLEKLKSLKHVPRNWMTILHSTLQ